MVDLDIFSPLPGATDVTSQIERLSSKETKIAPIVAAAVGSSCRPAIDCMGCLQSYEIATALCHSAGRYLPSS